MICSSSASKCGDKAVKLSCSNQVIRFVMSCGLGSDPNSIRRCVKAASIAVEAIYYDEHCSYTDIPVKSDGYICATRHVCTHSYCSMSFMRSPPAL